MTIIERMMLRLARAPGGLKPSRQPANTANSDDWTKGVGEYVLYNKKVPSRRRTLFL